MAKHFGGIGNTPIKDPRTQESDNRSENEFQDEDAMRQVLTKPKDIKQEMYRKPRDAIQEIEQKLKDLSLAAMTTA